jgi:hypothetical protein
MTVFLDTRQAPTIIGRDAKELHMKSLTPLARTLRWLIPLSLSLAAGAVARADSALDDSFTPRALGMGESLRGAATGSAAPMNPAGLSLVKNYALEGSYGYRAADNASIMSASVADSTTRVGMALYYNLLTSSGAVTIDDPAGAHAGTADRKRHEIGASMSFPITDRFVLGMTPKYTSYDITLKDPTQAKETSLAAHSRFNMDFGALVGLTPSLTLGVVGYNLLHHDVEYPRAVGGGLAFGLTNAMMLAADAVVDLSSRSDANQPGRKQTVRMSGGGEFVVAGVYPVRAGVVYDTAAGETFLTGGIGYLSPKMGLDVGFRQRVKGGSETVGMIGLKFFLPDPNAQQGE